MGLRAQVNWIREQIETPEAVSFSKDDKMRMLDRLCWSDHFEGFLAQKYATAKRFGLEGCEVLIVGMKQLIDTATVRPLASPLTSWLPSFRRGVRNCSLSNPSTAMSSHMTKDAPTPKPSPRPLKPPPTRPPNVRT